MLILRKSALLKPSRQSVLTPREIVLSRRQVVYRQTVLILRKSALLKPSRQSVLTPREIVLSPQAGSSQADSADFKEISTCQAFQAVNTQVFSANSQEDSTVPPRQTALIPRHSVLLPKPPTCSPRQLVISRQAGIQQYFPGRQAGYK